MPTRSGPSSSAPGTLSSPPRRSPTERWRRCTTGRCSTSWPARGGTWEASGLPQDPGQDRVVPYFFAHPGLLGTLTPALPAATWARTGHFAFDTMTPDRPGHLGGGARRGRRRPDRRASSSSPARPPLTRAAARRATTSRAAPTAAAATSTTARSPPRGCARRSAGRSRCSTSTRTTATARRRSSTSSAEVVTGSVHVDPGAGWFPHFLGFAGEDGSGAGTGANRNVAARAREPATSRGSPRCGELARWARGFGPRALVIALGVDAAAGDPESPLRVTADGLPRGRPRARRARAADGRGAGGRLRPGDDRRARARGAGGARRRPRDGRRGARRGGGAWLTRSPTGSDATSPRGSRSSRARTSRRRRTGGWRRSPRPSGRARSRSARTAGTRSSSRIATPPTCGCSTSRNRAPCRGG